MNRVLALSTLFVLAAVANGCTRERVIVVKEPSPDKNGAAVTTDKAIATDESGIANGDEADWGIKSPSDSQEYARTIAKVTNMVSDSDLANRVHRRNLALVNVAYEDTGRAQGSVLGPNISDLTLQVRRRNPNGEFESSIMPVIRPPNFVDRTGTSLPIASSFAPETSAARA